MEMNERVETVYLTKRQYDAAMIAITGANTKDCAGKMSTSRQVFKNHLRVVFAKSGCENRTQLAYRTLTGKLNLQVGNSQKGIKRVN